MESRLVPGQKCLSQALGLGEEAVSERSQKTLCHLSLNAVFINLVYPYSVVKAANVQRTQ